MSDINNKYGRNPQKFRKVYNYGLSRRPDVHSVVNNVSNITESLNFQQILRDRDYFLIDGYFQLITATIPPEYLEETISVISDDSFNVIFPAMFSGTPYIGLELLQTGLTSDSETDPNVAWWITDLTNTSFTVNLSAPFTGNLTYRAVYVLSTSFPVYVQRLPDLSGSYGWVSANSYTLNGNSQLTMSWGTLPSLPEYVNSNPIGSNSDTSLNVGQAITSVGTSGSINELSIGFDGTFHVVALDTNSADISPFIPNPDLGVP